MEAQRDFSRSKVLLSFGETHAFLQTESFYQLQCCNAATDFWGVRRKKVVISFGDFGYFS